jgi:serine/threonine-protein kinase HipA
MEDFCQLSGKLTEKKYSGSSEALGKIIDQYSAFPQDDKLSLFQIILFSFWTGNSDMHLKNFSLWRDPKTSSIRLSPCYDLINTRLLMSAMDDPEELALPVNAKKNKLKWIDFLALGKNYKIPEKVLKKTKEKMLDSIFETQELVLKSFLSDDKKEDFLKLLEERSLRLM